MRNVRVAFYSPAAILCIAILLLLCGGILPSGSSASGASGKELYQAACASCHGSDGRGRSRDQVGFDAALPDFTDCSFSSREQAADWFAIAHEGGPVRGFSEIMPAFGDALSAAELESIVHYVREFCREPVWPRGELNLPRAMVTEKAFPEDEAVLSFDVDVEGERGSAMTLTWEKRIGARGQVELVLPFHYEDLGGPAHWESGFGDLAVGGKYVLAHSLERGAILSVGGEVVLPTGDEAHGFGKGVTVVESFLAFGKLLPADAFLQTRLLVEAPLDSSMTKEAAWQTALGRTWTSGHFGRSWTPMIEILAARELRGGADIEWDVVPQCQISLNARQHVLFSIGAQLPLSQRNERDARIVAYFVWDWFDGGLFDGW